MSYHKALQGTGWVSIVPGGSYPDPVLLCEVEGWDLNVQEEDADLEDASGDVIDAFRTKRLIEGTLTIKDFSAPLLAAATAGTTVSTGSLLGYSQVTAVPGVSTYTITVTNGATFATDLGVVDLTAGKMLQCDAAAAAGKYSLNTTTGVYTFDASAANHSMQINYRATQSAIGSTATIAAATSTAYYGVHLYQPLGKPWGAYFGQCRIPGMQMKFSRKDWSNGTLKFKALKDSTGNFGYIYVPE